MSDKLIIYFSITSKTKHAALRLKEILQADILEIKPQIPYTSDDLDRYNKESRIILENNNPKMKPKICELTINVNDYTDIYIGYPIWWDYAPKVINTFIESVNLIGKKIYLFCTSESTAIKVSKGKLAHTYPMLSFVNAKRITEYDTTRDIERWVNTDKSN